LITRRQTGQGEGVEGSEVDLVAGIHGG
jgi:hypothetical protein